MNSVAWLGGLEEGRQGRRLEEAGRHRSLQTTAFATQVAMTCLSPQSQDVGGPGRKDHRFIRPSLLWESDLQARGTTRIA